MIRAVVRCAIDMHAMRVIGIGTGTDGLMWPEGATEMTEKSVSRIFPGGTILGTTIRGDPFAYRSTEKGKKIKSNYSTLCMDNAQRLVIKPWW